MEESSCVEDEVPGTSGISTAAVSDLSDREPDQDTENKSDGHSSSGSEATLPYCDDSDTNSEFSSRNVSRDSSPYPASRDLSRQSGSLINRGSDISQDSSPCISPADFLPRRSARLDKTVASRESSPLIFDVDFGLRRGKRRGTALKNLPPYNAARDLTSLFDENSCSNSSVGGENSLLGASSAFWQEKLGASRQSSCETGEDETSVCDISNLFSNSKTENSVIEKGESESREKETVEGTDNMETKSGNLNREISEETVTSSKNPSNSSSSKFVQNESEAEKSLHSSEKETPSIDHKSESFLNSNESCNTVKTLNEKEQIEDQGASIENGGQSLNNIQDNYSASVKTKVMDQQTDMVSSVKEAEFLAEKCDNNDRTSTVDDQFINSDSTSKLTELEKGSGLDSCVIKEAVTVENSNPNGDLSDVLGTESGNKKEMHEKTVLNDREVESGVIENVINGIRGSAEAKLENNHESLNSMSMQSSKINSHSENSPMVKLEKTEILDDERKTDTKYLSEEDRVMFERVKTEVKSKETELKQEVKAEDIELKQAVKEEGTETKHAVKTEGLELKAHEKVKEEGSVKSEVESESESEEEDNEVRYGISIVRNKMYR